MRTVFTKNIFFYKKIAVPGYKKKLPSYAWELSEEKKIAARLGGLR